MTTQLTGHPTFAGQLQKRIESARASREYECYREVLSYVLEERDGRDSMGSAVHQPSQYWEEELANFDYMFDASPLVIQKLRQHSFHITGIKVYDYRTHKDRSRADFKDKLEALKALDENRLLVPESTVLGGFGFEIDGSLFNIDTLKYYEALLALDRAAVLSDLREDNATRQVVMEIGAGWGGFPYQFKSLFPNVTYVIVDLPELFLFSATYLKSAFPEAKVLLFRAGMTQEEMRQADFVFVPNYAVDSMDIGRPHLVINQVSFQEMTTAQVDAYARRAYELGAPYLYSLNRERGLYNPELSGVSEVLGKYYRLHEVYMLNVRYTQMLKEGETKKTKSSSAKPDLGYKHLIGWRRHEL